MFKNIFSFLDTALIIMYNYYYSVESLWIVYWPACFIYSSEVYIIIDGMWGIAQAEINN